MAAGKLRPALLLGRVPGTYEDWLVCMISSQLRQHTVGFDERVNEGDEDFDASGLKVGSVIRVGRLAVVEGAILVGAVAERHSRTLPLRIPALLTLNAVPRSMGR
jgi:mRNA interferase MazF